MLTRAETAVAFVSRLVSATPSPRSCDATSRSIDEAQMTTRIPGRAQIRQLFEWVLPPRLRLIVFRLAAVVMPSQAGPQGFIRLAREFADAGRLHEAMVCWRVLHTMAPTDTRVVMQRVSCALNAGDHAEAEQALADSMSGAGLPPHSLIQFAGQLALQGHMESAGRILVQLANRPGSKRLLVQSPSILSAGLPDDVHALGNALLSGEGNSATRLLLLARLCFTFRNSQVASALFAEASRERPLSVLDHVAMLHGQAEVDPPLQHSPDASLCELVAALSANPEALGMLAKTALVAGETEVAQEAVRLALDTLYDGSLLANGVADDCITILQVLADLRKEDTALPRTLLERVEVGKAGVPKVFLCGFGWSGSGALYDAIRGVPGFCEFEGSGVDAIINEDADSEVTFVQGPGGFGDLWKTALDSGRVPWDALWDMFNLHVVGLSPIGYAEYKSGAAARNHVRRYGSSYTRPFRRFLEEYAQVRHVPRRGGLYACLTEATESLCAMLVRQSGKQVVLFNNAVFGRDAEMLEIFRSRRAAIVYRDPRDVYVDRRGNDRNHWRTPAQLATFYAFGLHRYAAYKRDRGVGDPGLREVSFERFVKDDRFRERVRAWLLGDLVDPPAISHFDPTVSNRNIGIHVGALAPGEQSQVQTALDDCRMLDALSRISWE